MSCTCQLSTPMQIVILIIISGIFGIDGQSSICDKDLNRCLEPLQEFSNSKFASTEAELKLVCPAMLDNIHCVEDFATQCMSAAERMALLQLFQGIRQVVNGLCTESTFRQEVQSPTEPANQLLVFLKTFQFLIIDTMTEYLRHAPCLWEDQNEYDRCASHYSMKVRFAETVGIEKQEVQKQICCAFYSFLTCSKSIYTLKCGADTAQFMERYLDMIAGPLIKDSCTPFQHSRICSSAMSTVSSWILVFLTVSLLLF